MGFIQQELKTHWAGRQLPVQSLCPSQHILHTQLHGQFIDVLWEREGQVHACTLLMDRSRPVLEVQGPASGVPGLPQSSIAFSCGCWSTTGRALTGEGQDPLLHYSIGAI